LCKLFLFFIHLWLFGLFGVIDRLLLSFFFKTFFLDFGVDLCFLFDCDLFFVVPELPTKVDFLHALSNLESVENRDNTFIGNRVSR
jgi:hypothetical protein